MPPAREPTWVAATADRARATGFLIADRFFGSRRVTVGASLQRPRKVPLRIEPKTYFANERTFLSWLSMATSLGGVSTALVALSAESKPGAAPAGPLSPRTTEIITACLLPVSIAMIAYALVIFLCRSESMRTKQAGFFTDVVGPTALAGLLLASLSAITVLAFVKVVFY